MNTVQLLWKPKAEEQVEQGLDQTEIKPIENGNTSQRSLTDREGRVDDVGGALSSGTYSFC